MYPTPRIVFTQMLSIEPGAETSVPAGRDGIGVWGPRRAWVVAPTGIEYRVILGAGASATPTQSGWVPCVPGLVVTLADGQSVGLRNIGSVALDMSVNLEGLADHVES